MTVRETRTCEANWFGHETFIDGLSCLIAVRISLIRLWCDGCDLFIVA
jgi:hypothetical protein